MRYEEKTRAELRKELEARDLSVPRSKADMIEALKADDYEKNPPAPVPDSPWQEAKKAAAEPVFVEQAEEPKFDRATAQKYMVTEDLTFAKSGFPYILAKGSVVSEKTHNLELLKSFGATLVAVKDVKAEYDPVNRASTIIIPEEEAGA